jgi:hypothetical protein
MVVRGTHLKSALGLLFISTIATATVLPAPDGIHGRQPQLAASGDFVAITFGAGNAIYAATSQDRGKSFTQPVKVAEQGAISLGAHRGPRIAIAGDALVVSAIYGAQGRGKDGDLFAWRSTDGGRTWSEAVRINDREASAREGLHAMAADSHGFVYAVWLDDRDGGKALYGASSRDGGATWSANKLIYKSPDGHICECCHPSVAIAADGSIYAMFRNWLNGSRDMYLTVSQDRGKSFEPASKLGEGTWPLNACPMDGGGIGIGPKGIETAWRRGDTVYVARPGAPEVALGKGKNPAIAGDIVIWSASDGLRVARGASASRVVAASGAFPSIVLAGGRPIAAWESGTGITITDKLE